LGSALRDRFRGVIASGLLLTVRALEETYNNIYIERERESTCRLTCIGVGLHLLRKLDADDSNSESELSSVSEGFDEWWKQNSDPGSSGSS